MHADQFDAVAFRFVDEHTRGRLIVAPGSPASMTLSSNAWPTATPCSSTELSGMSTSWTESRWPGKVNAGLRDGTSSGRWHWGKPGRLANRTVSRKIYIHVNNTNPMILEDSPERRQLEAAGFEVGRDGREFFL